MSEILDVSSTEIAWIYFSLLNNRSGLPISQKDMGYELHGLNNTLKKVGSIVKRNRTETIIVRASSISFEIIKGRFFPKLNAMVALDSGLLMLDKNGFGIRENIPRTTTFSKKNLETWFLQISIPPIK